jgi:hypothetical protein
MSIKMGTHSRNMGKKKCCLNAKKKKEEEDKATPVNNAVTTETSLDSAEISLSPWNYKIANFRYHKKYNRNRGVPAILHDSQLERL